MPMSLNETAVAAIAAVAAFAVASVVVSAVYVSPSLKPGAGAVRNAAAYYCAALAFNAAAASIEQRVTINPPLRSNVMLGLLGTVVLGFARRLEARGGAKSTTASPWALCVASAAAAALLFNGGVLRHVALRHAYVAAAATGTYLPYGWAAGVCLNLFGVAMHARIAAGCLRAAIARGGSRVGVAVRTLLVALVAMLLLSRGASPSEGSSSSDCAPWQPPADHQLLPSHDVALSSVYIATHDGTHLAADVHLPAGWQEGISEPLPTILHITRYNRALKIVWPFSLLLGSTLNTRSPRYVEKMVKTRGYALVSLDVRGTGSSFGTRPFDLHPDEVRDFQDVLAWVLEQPWCNGKVGSGGISYDGMSATRLGAFDKTGAVRAVAAMFAPDDVYSDLIAPGGILDVGFAADYTRFTSAGERNVPVVDVEMPPALKFAMSVLTNGTAPVPGGIDGTDRDGTNTLEAAVAQHQANWDMVASLRGVSFIDEEFLEVPSGEGDASTTKLSPADFATEGNVLVGLAETDVAVHVFGGYFDSGSVRGSMRMYDALRANGVNVGVTIGPWTHGARQNCSPWNNGTSTAPCYDVFEDVADFWDAHLRDEPATESSEDPGARIFTLGAEQWRTVRPTWPPPDAAQVVVGLLAGGKLSDVAVLAGEVPASEASRAPATDASRIGYTVDFTATSGVVSRWNLVQALLQQPVDYSDRAVQDEKLLSWTSEPLQSPMTLASAVATLWLDIADGSDAAIFAYLELVDTAGKVTYVTEGQKRAGHRSGTYLRADYKALQPGGGPYRVDIPLEPVSALLPAGQRLRVSVAGADADNFWLGNIDSASAWTVYHGTTPGHDSIVRGSSLVLTVEQ